MKNRGIFAIIARTLAPALAYVKDVLAPAPSYGVAAYRGGGRSAFETISAPRCHTQRYKNGRKRI